MPTETNRRGVLRWRAFVKIEGKTAASKWFGPGEKERRKAILWEEKEKERLQEENQKTIPTVSLTMGDWATAYLDDAQRRGTRGNYQIKRVAFRAWPPTWAATCPWPTSPRPWPWPSCKNAMTSNRATRPTGTATI
ncbi:MAG: hypothetical protein WAU47_10855 [Desulfobaccales bacterium]